jgi:peptide/nickel transport system ATP-binding protein
MPVLELQDLNVSFPTKRGLVRAVRDVSLQIDSGETYGLVGESGCGKSTVALAVMHYLSPGAQTSGAVLFKDQDVTRMSRRQLRPLRGNRMAMVYQDPQSSLNPSLTIERQLNEVIFAHEPATRGEARQRILEMLELVRMPDPAYILNRYPHQLSGGMQQRVVIAMALLLRPDLVIMDEPTTGLDVTVEAGVLDILEDLRREFHMAILYISHNLGVIARICDRVGVMYAGELVEETSAEALFAQPHHPYTLGLMRCVPRSGVRYITEALYSIPGRVPALTGLPEGCAFAARCPLTIDACLDAHPPFDSVTTDHKARCIRWQTVIEQPELVLKTEPPVSGEDERSHQTLLDVERLKVYFSESLTMFGAFGPQRQIKVVDGVSFELDSQQTLGIVGESGCGKSTIAKALAGLVPITAGKVAFLGTDFSQPIDRRNGAKLRQLQMVFQNPDASLNPKHTIKTTLTRPLRRFQVVSQAQEESRIVELLQAVNLDEGYLDRLPSELSGGEKQRVAIARAFAGEPELVVCDEPISSLDVSVQAAVINLLRRLQRERHVALIFIAHDLNMVRYVSDTVAVIYLGHICEIGPTEAIFNPPLHPYTEALISAIPVIDPQAEIKAIRLEGSVPSPANPPGGCRFHTRCPRKVGTICETDVPPGHTAGDGHMIFCHIPLVELTDLQTKPTDS